MVVRLSDEEHRLVLEGARIAGKPVADFVRSLIHEAADDEQEKTDILEAWIAACDASSAPESRQAALLALAGKVAAKSMLLRGGYMPMKEFSQAVNQILAISGLPTAHVKVTEESRSLNAHVHKTWEEMVDDAHRAHPQPSSPVAGRDDTGASDTAVIDARVVRARKRPAEAVEAAGG